MNAVLAMTTTQTNVCSRCFGSSSIDLRGRDVPCPKCSGAYSPPYNPDALRRLARTERKRLRNRVAVIVIETIAQQQAKVFPGLPPELVTTDRVLDRWGAFGSGLPAQNPDAYRESLPVPLDPDTQAVVTACIGPDPLARVNRYTGPVPERVRAITYDIWQRGAAPSYVGKKHGMKPRSFGRLLHDCLRMHKATFIASKHADLVSLIEAQP